MQIKKYRGADMQEALQKVKKDLGADAIILSTRQVRGGTGTFGLFGKPMLEVTAARELDGEGGNSRASLLANLPGIFQRGSAAQELNPENGSAHPGMAADVDTVSQLLARSRAETESLLSPLSDEIAELRSILQTVGSGARSSLKGETELQQIRSEIAEMRQLLGVMTAQGAGLTEGDYAENLIVLFQQLTFSGVEEKFARRMIEECQRNIAEKDLGDFSYVKIFLARMLMKILRVTGGIAPAAGQQKVMALVGPTGVGKTTTVAKLASEQLLKFRRKVGLITVDTFRIAAVEQLKVYAKIMGIPITVVNSKAELEQAIRGYSEQDVIFIDTAGRSQRDELQMRELSNLFENQNHIELCLTLAAGTKDGDMAEVTRRFGEIPLSSVLFTKLDETTAFGSLFNHSIRFKQPIGYLATGQKVPEDIEVATKERLVDLLLNISAS